MHKAIAIIKKVGNKFCVFSEDGTKNLGCSNTLSGAEERLRQVEYFKHKGSADMSDYKDFFNKLGKATSGTSFNPLNNSETRPKNININSETLSVSERLEIGTVAGIKSNHLLDRKEHFPVTTETQARSSMSRVMQLKEVPTWYSGTLNALRQEVYAGIVHYHPHIKLDVRVPVEQAVALSDGQESADTSKQNIKDPYDERKIKKDEVPQVARPTLTSAELVEACKDDEMRLAFAGELMGIIDQEIERVQIARTLCQRLLQSGLSGDEFDKLSTFVQGDILSELMAPKTSASDQRRKELISRMNGGQ